MVFRKLSSKTGHYTAFVRSKNNEMQWSDVDDNEVKYQDQNSYTVISDRIPYKSQVLPVSVATVTLQVPLCSFIN